MAPAALCRTALLNAVAATGGAVGLATGGLSLGARVEARLPWGSTTVAAAALLAESKRVLIEIGPRATLSALAHQTLPPETFEVIIVDDGSADGDVLEAVVIGVPHETLGEEVVAVVGEAG